MSVVGIRSGVEIRPPGEPDPLVVAEIERLLEMARSGELVGMAAAIVWRDESTSGVETGIYSRAMVGTLEMVKLDVVHILQREP